MFDDNVTFTFSSATDCRVKTSFMGSGGCTYTYSGKQVSIKFGKDTYAFTVDGVQMMGNLMGAGVVLAKQ